MEKTKKEKNETGGVGGKLGKWVITHKIQVIVLSLIVVFGTGFGVTKLSMSSDYRYFFGPDNPQRLAFESFQNVYAKDDSALIVIEHESGTIFNKVTLNAIKNLTDQSWQVPFSTRVDSISNFQHTEAFEDDLIVRDLVGGRGTPELSSDYIKKVKRIATSEPLLVNNVVNPKGTLTAINVRVTMPQKSPKEVPEVAKHVREMVKKWQLKYPGHKVYLSGMVFMNNSFNEAAINDMSTLIPLMYLIIMVIMVILLRTIFSVINTFIVIFFSVLGAMGFAGWAGIPITPPSSIAPTVILTLAIADSVHLLKSIINYMKKGLAKSEAIVEAMRVNFQPIFLTSLTTAIGFLSLNFSDTPPFADLGNITAVGVFFAFGLSVLLLPALTDLFPFRVKKSETVSKKNPYLALSGLVIRNKKLIVFSTIFLSIFLGLQVPKIKLNDQYVEYFDKTVQFRLDTDYIMNNLTGIYQVNFDLRSGESQGIARPDFLKNVDQFANYARSLSGVVHVNTVTDTFKRLNKNLHGDDQTYYKLPEKRDLAAQYLLLYEMSLPYGLDLNNRIDVDKAGTRVIITMGNLDTSAFLSVNQKLETWLKTNTPTEMHALGTSPAIMFSHITERNVKSMAWGTLLAFLLISLVLIISLKSLKYGFISLLPNIIPTLLSFGIWSLAIGEAGFAIAVVTSVTLGIVVDDTVHFLSKYVRARREKGYTAEEAVQFSFENVGPSLTVTSIILAAGFSILMLSPFLMNWTLGALSTLTIVIALLVDFTFLPAMLIFLDKDKNKVTHKTKKKGEGMKIKHVALTIAVISTAIGLSKVVKASETDPVKRGLEIAKLIDSHDEGWGNQVADVEMVLKNKQGYESKRLMKIKSLEVKNDGDKSLTIFKSPKDVKGTAFLSFSHSLEADDQWLYLPALKRVKRISSHNKSGPFMGSEFAYEDISSQEVSKYTYKFIKDTSINDLKGHLIERYPLDKNSGYSKQILWVDVQKYRVHKIEFYDRKGSKLKTLEFKGFQKYLEDTWRPDLMAMINHQNGKSTELKWSHFKFRSSINERDFDKNALKRAR